MYSIYNKHQTENIQTLVFSHRIALAGCNNGIIPQFLEDKVVPNDNPPAGWTIPIADYYRTKNQSVIIDIKPNNANEIVICELDTVFGFSHDEWSPIMFRLKQLYNDLSEDLEINKLAFVYPDDEDIQILYTMSYLAGSFKNGELFGKWVYPGKSSTNGLLLWPNAMTFFFNQIRKYDPKFLEGNFQLIADERLE